MVSGWWRDDMCAWIWPVAEHEAPQRHAGCTTLERERESIKLKQKPCIWHNCWNCSEVASGGNNWSLGSSVQPPSVLISSLHFHAFLLHPWSTLWSLCVCPLSCQPDSPWWWVADPMNHRALKPFLIPSKHIPSLWMMQWASYISLSCLVTRLTLMTNAGWLFNTASSVIWAPAFSVPNLLQCQVFRCSCSQCLFPVTSLLQPMFSLVYPVISDVLWLNYLVTLSQISFPKIPQKKFYDVMPPFSRRLLQERSMLFLSPCTRKKIYPYIIDSLPYKLWVLRRDVYLYMFTCDLI